MNAIKTIICALLLCGGENMVSAQNYGWEWAKSAIGAERDDNVNSICTDAAGNVYVTGYFLSSTFIFDNDTLTNVAGISFSDVFLAKYDASGKVLWAKSAGGIYYDIANSICTDVSGNVYIAGYYESQLVLDTITLTVTNNSRAIFLAKYDAGGNVLWAKSPGGNGFDAASSICTDALGNIYMTGNFYSDTLTFDADTLRNINNTAADVFIAKYDASGNVLWAKSVGGTDDDNAQSISVDAFGNVYTAGYFQSPMLIMGADTLTSNGQAVFLAKYDASGKVLWAKSAEADIANSVCNDASGNVYIAGNFSSDRVAFNTDTLINTGSIDAFIAKYDASGNVLWAKNVGGSGSDFANSICSNSSGNIYLAGSFSSPTLIFDTTTAFTNGSTFNMFIAKYAAEGDVLWAKITHESYGYINPLSVTVDNTDNLYAAGYFSGPALTLGTTTFTKTTAGDEIVLAKLSPCINNYLSINLSACDKYTFQDSTYTESGVYTQTISYFDGRCDTVITLNLIIYKEDTTVTHSGNTLTSNQSGASYQWIDCSKGQSVGTKQSYTPTTKGNYKVIVTLNGCSDTSACYSVNITRIEGLRFGSLKIWPNPLEKGVLYVESLETIEKIEVFDILGSKRISFPIGESLGKAFSVDVSGLVKGMYLLKVSSQDTTAIRKIVLE